MWVNFLALNVDYVLRTGAFDPSKASIPPCDSFCSGDYRVFSVLCDVSAVPAAFSDESSSSPLLYPFPPLPNSLFNLPSSLKSRPLNSGSRLAFKLPQQVQAEPGHQTYSGAF